RSDRLPRMRALLAASPDRGSGPRASGPLRPLRRSRLRPGRVMKTPLAFLGVVALPLYALDQATKAWVISAISVDSPPAPVIDGFFFLCHWQNTGAAFSLGAGNNGF